jgi:hypothetical protein
MAPQRTATPMSRSVTLEITVPPLYTVSSVPVNGPTEMLATRRANAATGQMGPPIVLGWRTTPFEPFLVCAMQIVALSAVRRFANPLEWWRTTPVCHSLMSHRRSGMVRFNQSVQPTLDGAPPLLVVSAWDGLVHGSCVAHTVRGSCVAHTHPSCWVPVSCPVGWVGAWLMRGSHPS